MIEDVHALPAPPSAPVVRRIKEQRERLIGCILTLLDAAVFLVTAAAIKLEGVLDGGARGPGLPR